MEIIQVSLKSEGKKTGTLHEDQYTFLIILRSFLLRKKMFQTKVVEEIKTHIAYLVTVFSFFRNSCFYEIIWRNVVGLERLQMT